MTGLLWYLFFALLNPQKLNNHSSATGSSASKAQYGNCGDTPSHSDLFLAASDGYYQYRCEDGKWVIDQAAMKAMRDEEEHKRKLYWALRTRLLTPKEMGEVEQYDYQLIVTPMTPFYEEDKKREFNAALLQQMKLQLAQRQPCGEAHARPDSPETK